MRRAAVTARRMHEHQAGDRSSGTTGRAVTMRRPQPRSPLGPRDVRDLLGLRGGLASAPSKIGRTVIEETTTAATRDRRADAELADQRDADASRPAIATMTMRPAVTTDEPEVGGGPSPPPRARCPAPQLFPESAEDEQRVVDAGAETEHDRDRGREVRDPEGRPSRSAGTGSTDHADERPDERHEHRRERAEQERQQDDRDRDADELAAIGASCWAARSATSPRIATCTPADSAVRAACSRSSPLCFLSSAGCSV